MNLPKILEGYIDYICNIKGFVEKEYKKGKLRIVGYFEPKKIEEKVIKLYQKIYDEELRKELKQTKMLQKGITEGIKKYKQKQGK